MELPPFEPLPVILRGQHTQLVPLSIDHAVDLLALGRDPSCWEFGARGPLRDLDDARSYIGEALERRDELAFAIVRRASGAIVGTTRFLDIRRAHRGLEIGHTWLGASARRTAINTECKQLLLAHAFDDLRAHRVQLKTDARNAVSQRAIERIGAQREGVLRKHMVVRDGYVRDTVMYAVTSEEWPRVRTHLEKLLAQRA